MEEKKACTLGDFEANLPCILLSISVIIDGSSFTLLFLIGPKLFIGLLKPHLYSKPLLNSIESNHHFSIDFEGNLPYNNFRNFALR